MTSASPPGEWEEHFSKTLLTPLLNKSPSGTTTLRQPNRDSPHLDRTTMSGAINGLKFDPRQSWPAEALLWHSQHSDQGSVSFEIEIHPDDAMAPSSFLTTTLVIVYIFGFIVSAWIILSNIYDKEKKTYKWDKPWVPAITRRDGAAMPFYPIFLLLPAILWPLVVAGFILVLIVSGLFIVLGSALGSATSCCGISLLSRVEQGEAGGDETTRDLELGVVAGGEAGGVPAGGGEEEAGSDRASVRSAVSAESELPPPYASVAPEEDGDGETDGLLRKSAPNDG